MASLAPKTTVLRRRLAAHLLRRCSFHYTIGQVRLFENLNPSDALEHLLKSAPLKIKEPIDPQTNNAWIIKGQIASSNVETFRRYVLAWWLGEAQSDLTIRHKMAFFLHTAFTASQEANLSENLYDHLNLLRYYALGNFKKFAQKMTLDTLMLQYLNNRENTSRAPNENYAREFLELFSIGKGAQRGPEDYTHFTEQDVRTTARILTGFTNGRNLRGQRIDPETKIPSGLVDLSRHDISDKTFSEAFQNTTITGAKTQDDMWRELNDFVEMVFRQPATAQHLCRRLYRFFVKSIISQEIENDIILPLAEQLMAENYELKPVLLTLLSSQHFYDEDDSDASDEIIGSKIKSPMELFFASMSFFELEVPNPKNDPTAYFQDLFGDAIQYYLKETGMPFWAPPTVAGYPPYYQEPDYHRLWFNSVTLPPRLSIGKMILNGKQYNSNKDLSVQADVVDFVRSSGYFASPQNATTIVQTFADFMFPEALPQDRFNYFLEILLGGLSLINWEVEWNQYLSTGDASAISIPLNNLCQALFSSPEYQLM
ncbi:MAG: DUF1800 family protein [Microscillaceae bacterium]|nr:DUF1800 family protein [Microscillaceae bacterium]